MKSLGKKLRPSPAALVALALTAACATQGPTQQGSDEGHKFGSGPEFQLNDLNNMSPSEEMDKQLLDVCIANGEAAREAMKRVKTVSGNRTAYEIDACKYPELVAHTVLRNRILLAKACVDSIRPRSNHSINVRALLDYEIFSLQSSAARRAALCTNLSTELYRDYPQQETETIPPQPSANESL
jgi:hypothetical protein